jgi:hypothetical protein
VAEISTQEEPHITTIRKIARRILAAVTETGPKVAKVKTLFP